MASIKSINQSNSSYLDAGRRKDKVVRVVYPRVHMFSFDLSLFQGNMSSGSMGFSLFNQPTIITVEKSATDTIIGATPSIEKQITKYVSSLRKTLGNTTAKGYLKIIIDIPSTFRHHTGLGLTTQITGGVVLAAAEVYGKVMSPKDLFDLGIGQVSALGINLMYNPGFIMEFGYKIDNNSTVSAHPDLYDYKESPSGSVLEIKELPWSAVIAVPKTTTSLSGTIEDDFWNDIYPDTIESSKTISYAILNYVIPGLISNDFDMFIKGLVLATESGTKPAEESIQNNETKVMLAEMRNVFGYAAISSLGPAIFSFVRTGDFNNFATKINSDNFDLFCINLNQPGNAHHSIHLTMPSETVKNGQQKHFFEDLNIPYDILSADDVNYFKKQIALKPKNNRSKIIVSFACLGKTHFANKYPDRAIDIESLPYRYVVEGTSEAIKADESLEYNDAFPRNYVEDIVKAYGEHEYLFVVLSIPTLKMLDDIGLEYTILYPDRSMVDVIIDRARRRGNNDTMLDILYKNLSTTTELELMESILNCKSYVFMKNDEYIEDLVDRGDI